MAGGRENLSRLEEACVEFNGILDINAARLPMKVRRNWKKHKAFFHFQDLCQLQTKFSSRNRRQQLQVSVARVKMFYPWRSKIGSHRRHLPEIKLWEQEGSRAFENPLLKGPSEWPPMENLTKALNLTPAVMFFISALGTCGMESTDNRNPKVLDLYYPWTPFHTCPVQKWET